MDARSACALRTSIGWKTDGSVYVVHSSTAPRSDVALELSLSNNGVADLTIAGAMNDTTKRGRLPLDAPKRWGPTDEQLATAALAWREDLLRDQVCVVSGGGSG